MEQRKDSFTREATSTNPVFMQRMQSDVQGLIAGEKEKMSAWLQGIALSYEDFRLLFASFGTYCLSLRGKDETFVADANNEPVLELLYCYMLRKPEFDGNLHKGIMLQGKYGCGKTILMETYSLLHNHIVHTYHLPVPLLTFVKSVELQNLLLDKGMPAYSKRPLIIDEFGRESKTVQSFGNYLRPISELLSVRSDTSVVTHGTTNFSFETLASTEFYGGMIGDRLREMFNFITLKGDSRRR